jgi:hypothetical protein
MPRQDEDRLEPDQFEAVMRRATELQERSARTLGRADAVRIARELGIERHHVERALEELGTRRRDPYRLIAWALVGLGLLLALIGIWRNLLRGLY